MNIIKKCLLFVMLTAAVSAAVSAQEPHKKIPFQPVSLTQLKNGLTG
jgi:hypothetical protein